MVSLCPPPRAREDLSLPSPRDPGNEVVSVVVAGDKDRVVIVLLEDDTHFLRIRVVRPLVG